eukprot:10438320-Prorocentrum_lima.AAC.1
MIEVYANPADRFNKGGSVQYGLMYPAPSCIISAVIFTPFIAKNFQPNTWRIAKQNWRFEQELIFEAVWYERADEIISILVDQRIRL